MFPFSHTTRSYNAWSVERADKWRPFNFILSHFDDKKQRDGAAKYCLPLNEAAVYPTYFVWEGSESAAFEAIKYCRAALNYATKPLEREIIWSLRKLFENYRVEITHADLHAVE